MLHVLAVLFALIAIVCLIIAIAGMGAVRLSARVGWLVRVLAVLCFAATVVLNVAAH